MENNQAPPLTLGNSSLDATFRKGSGRKLLWLWLTLKGSSMDWEGRDTYTLSAVVDL